MPVVFSVYTSKFVVAITFTAAVRCVVPVAVTAVIPVHGG